jgi:site-specific recombinase XerD
MSSDDRTPTELPDGTLAEQLPLFTPPDPGRGQRDPLEPPPIAPFPGELSPESTLALAITWFEQEMTRRDYALHTRENYLKGVTRLRRFLGKTTRLREIGDADLARFAAWVGRQRRADKTKELTITAVRTFFAMLTDVDILAANPAADMYPRKAHSPLPDRLFDAHAAAVRREAIETATGEGQPNSLPALLVLLLLDMGLRLGEAQRLKIDDIDLSDPLRPIVHVRYEERRHRAKQRQLTGPPDLATLLEAHLAERSPDDEDIERLFYCSRRYLQNVIERVGRKAGLRRRLTANTLRWTFALRQWQEGVDHDRQRRRLGLSKLGWDDVVVKLREMSKRPL